MTLRILPYLTNKTVVFLADGAVEDVDSVLVHTPAQTVGGGAVVAALTSRLRHRESSLQPSLVLLRRHQLTTKSQLWLLKTILRRLDYQSSANSLHTKVAALVCFPSAPPHTCVTHSSDLSLLQQAGTGVGVVSVGTRHLRLFAQHDDRT